MLLLNLLFIAIASQTFVAAAPKRKATDERIAAVFVKDSENGELRFLTSTNSVNQLITQKQDLLEQLRPSNGNNNNITPIYIDLNGGTTSTSPTSTSTSNSAILAAAASSSAPINAILPQIVGQAVAGGASTTGTGTGTGSTSRYRRRGNKRRRVNVNSNKRRRRRRPANKNQRKPQVVVVRPQRG